jgi:DNA-binding XRE family transcriptional regulator
MSTLFGSKIKRLRKEKHIPQRQLASILEIDTATYCKIEKGGLNLFSRQAVINLAFSAFPAFN